MLGLVMLPVALAFAGLVARGVFAEGPQTAARKQSTHNDAAADVAGAKDPQPPTKPSGAPDYTKITGFVKDANLPLEQPEVLWTATSETATANGQIKMQSLSDAVVADGVLYFGDDQGNLIAVSVKDQSELWTHAHNSRIGVTPSVDRDFVYFGSQGGITALRRDSGAVVWQHQFAQGAGESTPLPVGDHVFASGYDGNAYCLNRATGAVVWKHDFAADAPADQKRFEGAKARFQNIAARPNGSACDGKLFIQCVFDQSRVIALDCTTGERRWTFQAAGWISPAPTIANDRVYVASQDKHLYCLDRANGAVVWKFQTPSWLASQVAVHDGRVYLPHHGARLYQLAADSGKLIQTFEPPDEVDRAGLVYSFPIIANQTVYFASGAGLVFAFDIDSGKLRWKLRPSEHSELFTNPKTDGTRIFVTARQNGDKKGECAVLVIGLER
jgi:outer membrane protein assembly factor BamB